LLNRLTPQKSAHESAFKNLWLENSARFPWVRYDLILLHGLW
jgi:hypothetical protein